MRNLTGLCRVIIGALPFLAAPDAFATALEYQVKASYLYNFTQFIVWPVDVFDDAGQFKLCIVGAEPFGNALNVFTGERVAGHDIALHRLSSPSQARSLRCHLLFVPGHQPESIAVQRGLLIVGEAPGFLGRGGIINLVEDRGRIRFEINRQAANEAGLTVSSRILSLAVNRP